MLQNLSYHTKWNIIFLFIMNSLEIKRPLWSHNSYWLVVSNLHYLLTSSSSPTPFKDVIVLRHKHINFSLLQIQLNSSFFPTSCIKKKLKNKNINCDKKLLSHQKCYLFGDNFCESGILKQHKDLCLVLERRKMIKNIYFPAHLFQF